MKVSTACSECRVGKRRCIVPFPGDTCTGCARRRLKCSKTVTNNTDRLYVLRPVITTPLVLENHLSPSLQLQESLVDTYIAYIHNKPHSLFHEPSLRANVKAGKVTRQVLFGIFGLSARFSSDPNIRVLGKKYADEARRCLKADLENVSLQNTQACILVANMAGADADANAESIYFGIANRTGELLDLAHDRPTDSWIVKEEKRRVWWSLYLIDRWSSAGIGLQRQFYIRSSCPQLPMDEIVYNHARPEDPEPDMEYVLPGLWAHMITLVRIFGHIQDLNRQIVDRAVTDAAKIELSTQELATQLDVFVRDLPESVRYSTETLTNYIKQGQGRTFVALHLGYHHYSTLLYYQYLDHRRQTTPVATLFAERCKYHSAAFSDLVGISRKLPGAEAFYNIVGHMTVVSSSVLVHTLLFGSDEELASAKYRLEENFEALVQLRQYWPSLELMTSRLITFQNSCLKAIRDDTHELNRWMLNFLLQHALELDEKNPFVNSPVADWGRLGHVGETVAERLLERSRISERIIMDAHAAHQ